jgi:aerobic carbon-monoxide dehydrogenase medium subunit
MKARSFNYIRPAGLAEALSLLEQHGEGAVPLAGGQSLLATLNMRLSSPELLVDIGEIEDLKSIAVDNGEVVIGALTTYAELLASVAVQQHLPLIVRAVRHVAHVAIRNRGTLGGSLAYADPAAEMPACAIALGATVVVGSSKGRRSIAAADFFKGMFMTVLGPGELILAVRYPVQSRDGRWAFLELSRRRGDFAIAGLAAVADTAKTAVTDARVVYFGCVEQATLALRVSEGLRGKTFPLHDISWIDAAVEADIQPLDSSGWRGPTKLRLAKVLTSRALRTMQAYSSEIV